ncbi:aspartyl protease family protein [Filimonas effusa]|uniref:PDZ domain-containing protein n=1 Tax=Filimonas effusa TaxID=2508721 RepID=A0A4V1MA40_9BACT|nr:aspartyl protease family protein [Filimonas effusa]RXK83844.1 PDZ domain-containing protein [Filimonas effusa]
MKLLAVIALFPVFFGAFHKAWAAVAFEPPRAKLLTHFPFKMLTGGIIIIRATIDGHPDSLNFVFDTGSGGISLDSLTAEEMKITSVASERTIRGIAGSRKVNFAYNHRLHLPGLTVDSLDFHINNYDLLTSTYGLRIDGIMGYAFLRRYIVYLNYDVHQLEVYSNGDFPYPGGGYFLKPGFSALPFQPVTTKDAKKITAKYYLDTGAGLCMLFSRSFIRDSGLLSPKRQLLPTQAEGLGGKKSMEITFIKELKIGPYRFRRVPVYIFDDDFNVTSYPSLGGLLGNDIMRRFNVVLNYAEQTIHIKPNQSYLEAFDYSYTGMSIYLIEDIITVVDIVKGSPAGKAGFLPGDKIISINNHFSADIQTYKSLLQHANTTCRVLVSRGGSLYDLKLKIGNILRPR